MGTEIKNKLSIIVPVYNEENTIEKVIKELLNLKLYNNFEKEIIIVNDWSNDKTESILRKLNNSVGIKIIFNKENKWKWNAIINWLNFVTWNYTIIKDADLEYNIDDINKMLEYLYKNNLDILFWSRILWKSKRWKFIFYIWWRFVTFVSNILYNQKLTDQPTCYKLIKTDLLKSMDLKEQWFWFCSELTAKAWRLNYKINEIWINYNPRDKDQWKKIKIKDWIIAFLVLIKYFKRKNKN